MANSSVFGAIMAQISGHRGTETRRKILSLHWRIRFYCNIPGVRVRSPRLRARQEIRCAFWRERRAGRCEAPRRRRCRCASSRSGNKADARPPPRPSGLRPAGPLAVLLAPYIPHRVCSSLAPCQRAWRPAAKCTPYFLTGPKLLGDAVVADEGFISQHAAGADASAFANMTLAADDGAFDAGVRPDSRAAPDHGVLYEGPLFYPALLPQNRILDCHPRFDHALALQH